jgi:hypothetical protein
MDLQKEIVEKVKLFEAVKNQLGDIAKRMGALQEEQRAVYNQGLELKGAIDILVALKQKEDADLKASKTAGLILPEGVKPIVSQESSVVAPVTEKPIVVEQNTTPVTPTVLEVK